MKILAATTNEGKVREIKKIFSDESIEIISLKEAGINAEVEENGSTFCENARIKAYEIAKLCELPVLADDSGLTVDALDGAPGIYSARYAGEGATDEERIEKLLHEMEGKTDRTAQFRCAVAFIACDGEEICAEGMVSGRITESKEGENGFGYDPVFWCDELGKTFAEANAEEKNRVSHRGRALKKLYEELIERGIL